jgi:hypothetical protein
MQHSLRQWELRLVLAYDISALSRWSIGASRLCLMPTRRGRRAGEFNWLARRDEDVEHNAHERGQVGGGRGVDGGLAAMTPVCSAHAPTDDRPPLDP